MFPFLSEWLHIPVSLSQIITISKQKQFSELVELQWENMFKVGVTLYLIIVFKKQITKNI